MIVDAMATVLAGVDMDQTLAMLEERPNRTLLR